MNEKYVLTFLVGGELIFVEVDLTRWFPAFVVSLKTIH